MTCFISGHCDLTKEEFLKHYQLALDKAIALGRKFVVGDSRGADTYAQQYLHEQGVKNVTVYHLFSSPRCWFPGFLKRGEFHNHDDKDRAMTEASDVDILWVRPVEECKKFYGKRYKPRTSGTEKNQLRRAQQINDHVEQIYMDMLREHNKKLQNHEDNLKYLVNEMEKETDNKEQLQTEFKQEEQAYYGNLQYSVYSDDEMEYHRRCNIVSKIQRKSALTLEADE